MSQSSGAHLTDWRVPAPPVMSQPPEEQSSHAKNIDRQWRMRPPIPPQCRISQELWVWAKSQVLSSLRLPFGIGAMLPTLKKGDVGKSSSSGKDGSCNLVPGSSLPKVMPQDNPMKSSRTHQELHRELLLTYRKGLVLHSKPELLQVLEKRRNQERESQEPEPVSTPLQKELQKWQQRREEREQESARSDVSAVHEFLRVRENLRKLSTKDLDSPPPPVS
ncbi:uncharacterized protein O3C94_011580 [Discoglossus pictus]